MPRPKKPRCLCFQPNVYYYKPAGIPLRELEEVNLFSDELEALKLHDVDGFNHVDSAQQMNVSQPTFGRILDSAYKKLAQAVVGGQAIRIEKVFDK
ncbi:DUF134 domain-containing protein [Patescibacteria group bacterium]|nr:DUF134 domain-containing protein [Patescibacteria group bacterium]MBU1885069.1 DUF134 domain-containing protein [Patescibacteria group bacterium]